MAIYYIIFVFILISIYLEAKDKQWMSYLMVALMFLLTAFRGDMVGADTWTYLNNFSEESREGEWLTVLIYGLVAKGVLSSRAILVFYAAVTYLLIPVVVRQNKIKLSLFLLFFYLGNFFFLGLNVSRQVTSVMIAVAALPLCLSKSLLKNSLFVFVVLFASGLHLSTSIFLVLLLSRVMPTKPTLYVVLSIILVPFLIFNVIQIEPIIGRFVPESYTNFSTSKSSDISILGYLLSFVSAGISIYYLYYISKDKIGLYFICILASLSSLGLNSNVARAFMGFVLIRMIVLAILFSEPVKTKELKVVLYFNVVLLLYTCFKGLSENYTLAHYYLMF